MTRYVTRPVGWDDWDGIKGEPTLSMDVHEAEEGPVKTGILDAAGNPIFRVPSRLRVGFDLRPVIKVKSISRKL